MRKCKYLSEYIGREYCDNINNTDYQPSSSIKKKHLKRKRCLPEFCPLLKGKL